VYAPALELDEEEDVRRRGYVDFTPAPPCLVHAGRAASVAAQGRCFERAVRATDRKIVNSQKVILRSLHSRLSRSSSIVGEHRWRRYERHLVRPWLQSTRAG